MKQRNDLFTRFATDLELPGEVLPGQSLLELAGDNRVLIENHHGVLEYSRCRIGVALGCGQVQVCGSSLELVRMSQDQLVIIGQVESIHLLRRDAP